MCHVIHYLLEPRFKNALTLIITANCFENEVTFTGRITTSFLEILLLKYLCLFARLFSGIQTQTIMYCNFYENHYELAVIGDPFIS